MGQRNIQQFVAILVILIVAIWLDLPSNPGIHVAGINKEIKTQLGLDLIGGTQALLEADVPEGTQVDPEAMRTARSIVENRVNALGVTEAVVQLAGDRRIVVEIPGIEDPEEAISTIKGTALLEFVDLGTTYLPPGTLIKTDYGVTQAEQSETNQAQVQPASTEAPQGVAGEETQQDKIWHTVLTGAELKQAIAEKNSMTGEYAVTIEFNEEGAKVFADYTTSHVNQYLAIVLDKTVISSPVIREPIRDGKGQISGDFDLESANALAIQLRYGALPVPLRVVETRTVGPTLGQDSLQKSLIAGMVGLILVMLFMILYYRLPGVVANIAILIYGLVTFALFRSIPVTLTLSGIAGLILSTGSALDANILIFERFKEEMRSGKTLRNSLDLGWKRAWPSIRDSNIAALITCTILFWFGSVFGATIVKGFALTLFFGVCVSLFTAIVVTRTLLDLVLTYWKPVNLGRWFGV